MQRITSADQNRENSHFISERAHEFLVSCSRDTLLFTVCWNIVKTRRKLCNFLKSGGSQNCGTMNVEDLYWFAFTVVTIVSFFTFKLLTRHRRFFTARGVPHEKPHFLYGNLNAVLSGKVSPLEHVQEFYRKYDGER